MTSCDKSKGQRIRNIKHYAYLFAFHTKIQTVEPTVMSLTIKLL